MLFFFIRQLPVVVALLVCHPLFSQALPAPALQDTIACLYQEDAEHLLHLYQHYHENPETGGAEIETAKRQAAELRALGYGVHKNIGGHGVVAVLDNGPGPVIYWRADLDALPLEEGNPQLAYRSKKKGVAHLCAHDMHATLLVGIAHTMYRLRQQWSGKLVLVSQPAEEGLDGARAMLRDSLYARFGTPDYVLAYHMAADLKAGEVGICPGRAMALTRFLDIRVFGEPGHGGNPHLCVDAPVLAAMIIVRLQALVAREINPLEPAVLSVCAINGGSQYASMPPYVDLKVNLRCFSEAVHGQLLEGIRRVCRAEAEASGLGPDKYPLVQPFATYTEALYNDPALAGFMAEQLKAALGPKQVHELSPVTTGEDFAHYALAGKIPILLVRLGAVPPAFFDEQGKPTKRLEPLHAPNFYPEPELGLRTGVQAMTNGLIGLFNKRK